VTLLKSVKAELIWWHASQTCQQVTDAQFKDINGFHNTRRRHSTPAGKSPVWFEQKTA
jgi:hypothetical protein